MLHRCMQRLSVMVTAHSITPLPIGKPGVRMSSTGRPAPSRQGEIDTFCHMLQVQVRVVYAPEGRCWQDGVTHASLQMRPIQKDRRVEKEHALLNSDPLSPVLQAHVSGVIRDRRIAPRSRAGLQVTAERPFANRYPGLEDRCGPVRAREADGVDPGMSASAS